MKVVVLAAGKGVRMVPITETRPKHMIPIGGKPMLENVLMSIVASGLRDILLVVGYRKELVKGYFEDGEKLGAKIRYIEQHDVSGTASAIGAAEKLVDDREFASVYGDLCVTGEAIKRVVSAERDRGENTMAVVPVQDPSIYGIVSISGRRVTGIVEKPRPQDSVGNLANAGIYVFNRDIFRAIRETKRSVRNEFEITDSIRHMLDAGHSVNCVELKPEEWMDIGRPWDLLEANRRVVRNRQDLIVGEIEPNVTLIGPVTLLEGSRIRSGTRVEGPTIVGVGCEIGPNCVIRPSTSIGNYVSIGNACQVENSIIMDRTKIGSQSYVGDSVVGERCNLEAGTKTISLSPDGKSVEVTIGNERVDTGKVKLGAFIGDDAKTGVNVTIMPGVKIGVNMRVESGVVVYRDISSDVHVRTRWDARDTCGASV